MPRLWYPGEVDAQILITALTEGLAGDGLKMRLRGNDGRERMLSALDQPRWQRYRTLADKAGALHFFLNKGHPFVDGNKRFAVAAMELFLGFNDAYLGATDDEVVGLALGVADGTISLSRCRAFLRQRVFRVSWSDEEATEWVAKLDASARAHLGQTLQVVGLNRGDRLFRVLDEALGRRDQPTEGNH